MWIYFNKKGQVLEILEHGSPAVSGTTNFEIFAFFEDVDVSLLYTNATIKLKKPDLTGSQYPLLLMKPTEKEFVLDEEHDEHSNFFEDGEIYKGYYFDFADFNTTQDTEVLLDTPGLWQAVVSLMGNNRRAAVQGVATFYVLDGLVSQDGAQASIDTILNQIFVELSTKLNVKSDAYLRVVDDITDYSQDGFPPAAFSIGDIIFNRQDGAFYKLNSLDYIEGVNPEYFTFLFGATYFENVTIGTTLSLADANSVVLRNGDHLATQETLEQDYVPYNGANKNLDLGENSLIVGEMSVATTENGMQISTDESNINIVPGGELQYKGVEVATVGYVESEMESVQEKLTFDEYPRVGSENPVKSNGIATTLDGYVEEDNEITYLQVLAMFNDD